MERKCVIHMLQFDIFIFVKWLIVPQITIVYGCTQCVIAQVSATSLGFILGYVVHRLVIQPSTKNNKNCHTTKH